MIEELLVSNFKCLDEIRLPLKPLSVLTGLNGMGKSSALQGILLLHQSHQFSPDGTVRNLVLNGPLINIGNAKDALWEGAKTEQISLGFVANRQEYVWSFAYKEGEDEMQGFSNNPRTVPSGHGIFTNDFHYLRAERFGPKASFPLSNTAVRQRHQIGCDGEYAPFYLATFGSEELVNKLLLHPSAKSPQLKHQLEAWLSEVSPGTRVYTQTHAKLDLVSLEFAFASPLGETEHFRATNVGFGITYILPIVLAALASTPGTLILLENPEAHLHPQGQTKMGELLGLAALGGAQILVETHSDHLLNGIRLAVHSGKLDPESVGLNFFERDQDEGTISTKITTPKIDKSGRLDSWPKGFFDESEKALRQLLLPRKT